MNWHRSAKLLSMLVLIMFVLTLLPLGTVASTTSAPQTTPGIEVEPELMAQIEADDTTGYLVYFREKADLSPAYEMNWSDRGWFVYETLTSVADRSQARVREYLSQQGADFQAFWIDNVIAVESSDYDTFDGLLGFPEIEALRAQRQAILYEPVESSPAGLSPDVVEPNIDHVGAPAVWAMGYTGQGIVVANIDSGVRYTHAALVNQYRGNLGGGVFDHNYNWWDPAAGGQDLVPNDWHNHGSHTMGTILGDDGGNNQVGMAPGARWIACQDFETAQSSAELLECGQFMAAPWDLTGANPNPDLRPHIVNNSWGDCGRAYDPWYAGVIDAWHAAGVYPVFSNGNNSNCNYPVPPGCNTVGNPARYGNVTGVGSTGRDNGQYATHSNWGPTDDPDTINPLGYPIVKPQIVAPGVDIRSCYRGSDTAYGTMDGTSMSSPHVTGLVALMWSAAPCLIGDYANTETIIQQTATTIPYASNCGGEPPTDVPNFATGWGEIDALAAVQEAINFCGEISWLDGHVYDAATLAPIENALVDAGGPSDLTDASGYYTITLLAGTYDVEASHPQYTTAMTTGIVVTTDTVTTVDFHLQPRGHLFGYVANNCTDGPVEAVIDIAGGALITQTTSDPATGYYSAWLVSGTYQLDFSAAGYLPYSDTVDIVAGQTTTLDVDLVPDAPCIAVDPDSFEVWLFTGTLVYTHPTGLDIINNGGAPLTYEIVEDVPWIWEDPVSGTVPAFDAANVGINFTALYTDMVTPMPLGTYTSTLDVDNNAGPAPQVPAVMHIVDQVIAPTAAFTTTAPECVDTEMWFYFTGDLGAPAADSFTWDFDGVSMTVGTPDPVAHTYTAAGTYTVTLEVCNVAHACDTATAWVEVEPETAAGFGWSAVTLTVTFANSSQNADSYLWDFGDGATSTTTHPVHVYTTTGTYTVTLTAYGPCGTDEHIVAIPVSDVTVFYIYLPLTFKGYGP